MGLKTYHKLNKTLVYEKALGVTSAKASEVPDITRILVAY